MTLALLPLLFGLIAGQELTGSVFLDRNGNGARDAGEPGIGGVAVSDQDTVVPSAADGSFRLPSGRGHGLVFVSVPSGHRSVGPFWRTAAQVERGEAHFALAATGTQRAFRFAHASDTHISEATAPRTRRMRAMVDSVAPAFVLITGDLVRDALRVSETEARGYYDLFARERAEFRTPVHTSPGNHEIFGIEQDLSKVPSSHPLFGKAMYRSYFGPDYYSFTFGGVHFISLNTEDIHEGWYYGHVDSRQLRWLAQDLAAVPHGTPVVTFNHIPFYSTADQLGGYEDGPPAPTLIKVGDRTVFRHHVSNADSVLALLERHNLVLALGGHVHVAERIDYERAGQVTRFENGAATVAPAVFRGREFQSGFSVYEVRDGLISESRFVRLAQP